LVPFEFVLPRDRGDATPTTWRLAPLTILEQDTAQALTAERVEFVDGRTETMEVRTRGTADRCRTAVLRAKLIGWSNFCERGPDGAPVPIEFRTEKAACQLTGQVRDLVPDDLLARIPLDVRRALTDELWFRARLSVDDRKN